MGLSVVHAILEELQGLIHCSSQLGKGSQFDLFFPQSKPDISTLKAKPESKVREPLIAKKSLDGVRLLLVDDQWLIREALQERLELEGAVVTSASEAITALEAWEKDGPMDLLITDLGLPGQRGDQLALELIKKKSALPVIIITGYPEKIDHNFFQREKCKVIIKPINQEELLEGDFRR